VGSSYYDLQEIKTVELEEPQGWVVIPLALNHEADGSKDIKGSSHGHGQGFVRTHCLQIAVLSNHQNGRDTHLRQIKVFGPRM
jgi:anaphase-promoting complex subunit 10